MFWRGRMTIAVLSVASEAYPLVKTGGLADVVGALPAALAPHGVAVKMQLAGDGADAPLVGQVQTQDLGAQIRSDSHYAPTCCGEESIGAS